MKKKVLIVGAFPPKNATIFGGILTTCKTLIDSDFSKHFELVLIDSTQLSNPPPNFLIRLYYAIRRFTWYSIKLFTQSPDAVLLFTAVGASLLEKSVMAWFARLLRIPVFLFPRGAELIDAVKSSTLQEMWVKTAMRGATHLLCQGPAWQRFAVNVLNFDVLHAPVIHNWSATPQLLRIGSQRKATPLGSIPQLLFLGWLEQEKGIIELLAACKALSHDYLFVLTIAGRGHAETKAKNFVSDNRLDSHIRFVGWVQGEEKETLLNNADILVFPSWAEGFPNAIIEAMAAKLAVIVTAVGNVPDILEDKNQVLLIPPKNTEELKLAIQILLCDSAFREKLAERGYAFTHDTFSIERGITQLITVIDEAIIKAENDKGKKSCVE